MKTFRTITLLLLALVLMGCGGSGGGSRRTNREAVEATMDQYVRYFNNESMNIMDLYSRNYLYDGVTYHDEEDAYYELFHESPTIDFRIDSYDLEIDRLTDNFATVTMWADFRVFIHNPDGTDSVTFSEEELVFYLRKENGDWLLYGNQDSRGRAAQKATATRIVESADVVRN